MSCFCVVCYSFTCLLLCVRCLASCMCFNCVVCVCLVFRCFAFVMFCFTLVLLRCLLLLTCSRLNCFVFSWTCDYLVCCLLALFLFVFCFVWFARCFRFVVWYDCFCFRSRIVSLSVRLCSLFRLFRLLFSFF